MIFRKNRRLWTVYTRGFSRVRREFPKAEGTNGEAARKNLETFYADHYKDLTENGNRARKVSGTQHNLS